MWYRYDTTITGDDSAASTVMLQHEGSGRSVLTLRGDGKYHTYVNGTDVVSQRTVVKGGWEHITITIDQDSRQVKFYINGELDSQQALTDNAIDQVLTLRLGAHKTAGNKNPHPMRGDVDEFYVYNRVLTDEEAWAVYADKGTQLCRQQLQELVTQGQTLYDSGLIRDKTLFRIQELLSNYAEDGFAEGTYTLSTAMTPEELMDAMAGSGEDS